MALDGDIDLLSRLPLFQLFHRDALRLIAFSAETRILRAGDVLFRKGEATDGGYVVVTGSIALDPRDDGSPAAAVAGPGALIGETALFIAGERPATAIARESTTIMKLPTRAMLRVLAEMPEDAARVREMVAQRLAALSGDLARMRERLLKIE